jgi:hypothetical protein
MPYLIDSNLVIDHLENIPASIHLLERWVNLKRLTP